MHSKLRNIQTVAAKGFVAVVAVIAALLLADIPASAQSGNTNNAAKEQETNPMQEGANMDKGTYTQKDSVRGKAYGNTGTSGAMQDTTRNGQRSGTRGNQSGVYGNTGGQQDSIRTNGQQMSNSGNRNDTLMGPIDGGSNSGLGEKNSGTQRGSSGRGGNKTSKGNRSGNQSNASNPH